MMGYYDYEELEKAALTERTEEALNALGEWFEHYGRTHYWNGQCYKVNSKLDLYPIYAETGDIDSDDYWEIVGWELR